MENTEKIFVCNTFTDKYEEVEVSKEVATVYKRTGWCIEKQDQKFFDNEIQFSQLIGGNDEAYENFNEFINNRNTPERYIENKERISELKEAITLLKPEEQLVIKELFFNNKSQQDISDEYGIKQTTVSLKKRHALLKLKLILEEGNY